MYLFPFAVLGTSYLQAWNICEHGNVESTQADPEQPFRSNESGLIGCVVRLPRCCTPPALRGEPFLLSLKPARRAEPSAAVRWPVTEAAEKQSEHKSQGRVCVKASFGKTVVTVFIAGRTKLCMED